MSADRKSGGRTRLLAGALLVATFAAGALVGIASEQVLSADEPGRGGERRSRDRDHDLFGPAGELTRRLDLSEAQRTEILRIVDENRAKADSIFDDMRPRLRARYDSATAAVRGVLTPEQQAEYDLYRAERRERMHRKSRDNDNRRSDEGR